MLQFGAHWRVLASHNSSRVPEEQMHSRDHTAMQGSSLSERFLTLLPKGKTEDHVSADHFQVSIGFSS